jgi:hypothetical protein
MNGASCERVYSLTVPTYIFVGRKPAAVLFGDERVEVKSWREVVGVILGRCNSERHERLMYLCDKVHGKVRTILSASKTGMRRPLKIDEYMYIETQYGSQTMMYILRDMILAHTGFDCSDIRIALK